MQILQKDDTFYSPLSIRDKLLEGIKQLGLSLEDNQMQKLHHYLHALSNWNKTYNLTAIKSQEQMLIVHLLDSLSVAYDIFQLKPKRLIDVGTGAGLPGLIMAIIYPQLAITLLDTNSKKTRFLIHCKHYLKLDNVMVKQQRVEQYHPSILYDGVVSRAFSCLNDMLLNCRQLIHHQGFFAAMKGQYPEQEIRTIRANPALQDVEITQVKAVKVPYLEAQRHLVLLRLQSSE